MTPLEAPQLLLVDDEPNVLKALERQLRAVDRGTEQPYRIESYTSPAAALERAGEQAFDLVISDYRMPHMDGVSFLAKFRALQPYAARLILSGHTDSPALLGAINSAGVMRFLCKPWEHAELVLAVENALLERALLLENLRLADEVRVQQGIISRQEAELRRLEAESPGITRVNWGPDGSILIDPDPLPEKKTH
ncbi:MAG: response regulator [Pseudomonadota bacterium]|jgi:response regulator RpfG family c-di-GMP phosphodiesterase